MSPVLAGGLFTMEPPGKPRKAFFLFVCFLRSHSNIQISFQFDTDTSCGISSVCVHYSTVGGVCIGVYVCALLQ